VNAGTRAPDLAWMRRQALEFGALEISEREDLAMLAVQGPLARAQVVRLLPADAQAAALSLDPFCAREIAGWFIARTGYTGEDGFEVILPAGAAVRVWRELNALQVASCGLGARDTLRLEAGMNLYGADMDELHNPLESGLGWTVAFAPAGRAFIGRAPLEALKRDGVPRKLVGLVLEERGVLRAHQKVLVPGGGEVTSGTFSPSLERSIGFARVPQATPASVVVEVRGKPLAARIVKPPFIRHGRSLVTEIAG
ncbi:MAG TPA: glycine cleavage T C-terminal barrel domain-containing protein, partial [Steroidobacteraceae bacterium]